MRITRYAPLVVLLLAGSFLTPMRTARAQDTAVMMPEQSAAKAKQILQQAVEAMGGGAYLNVKDITCTGRLSQFGHSGELNGFEKFIDYNKPPDKDRTENLPKRNLIEVFNGKEGWILDRGGVQEAPEDSIGQFQEDQKKDIDNTLRHRIHEPDMVFRYSGPDIVDLKEVDWIELVDSEDRTMRIAVTQSTHLPIRKVVVTRDPNTRLRSEEIEYYSNYHPVDGVMTPFQITRERNNLKVYQVFFDTCKYNTAIADSLFTKQSLDERWSQVGKKEIKKRAKQEEKDKAEKDKD
ncbi:MAG: hypothetical protein WBC04_18535 [Candidatus Acidiferrales bacterium]